MQDGCNTSSKPTLHSPVGTSLDRSYKMPQTFIPFTTESVPLSKGGFADFGSAAVVPASQARLNQLWVWPVSSATERTNHTMSC